MNLNGEGADIGGVEPLVRTLQVKMLHPFRQGSYVGRRFKAVGRRSRQLGPCWPGNVTGLLRLTQGASCNFASMESLLPTSGCTLFALLHLAAVHYAALPPTVVVVARAEFGEDSRSHKCKMHDPRDESKDAWKLRSEVLRPPLLPLQGSSSPRLP